ncbi:tetratricopeptide repeat protein [Amycolatopsis cynarae]|uniref:Tetratricopeptide repeat protein n=1 Tax=Amycolatopsis cynarae TaxID=2995223 RepID=A0ABY7AUS0_9PSEU|nr:tetratricopeptide repeat protein [Amycolatopsis sp. HUAS 11-8]WAL63666.1 tetratricopeptide repeat protein [Amycolatopsis sp. HUAS 11-8]
MNTSVVEALHRWDAGDRRGGEQALRVLTGSTDAEVASAAGLGLALRQLLTAPEDAVTTCRRVLEGTPSGDLPRILLVLGWANLALDAPEAASNPLRLAAGSQGDVAGPAALLCGFVSFLLDDARAGLGAWHRALSAGGHELPELLRNLDFTEDVAAQVRDDSVWSPLEWGRILLDPGAPPVLPGLLRRWNADHGFWAALALHALNAGLGNRPAARRAAEQAVALDHPRLAASAWLALAESLVQSQERAAAMDALRQAVRTARADPLPIPQLSDLFAAPGAEPRADVITRATTLLGVLQREAGDLEAALATLAGVAESEDPDAILAHAQTLRLTGHHQAARAALLKLAGLGTEHATAARYDLGVLAYRDGDDDSAREWWLRVADSDDPQRAHDARNNLGLLAKRRRDLPEALRWFGRIAESGHGDAPLAAAHLGELCYQLGDKPAALRWYRHALERTGDPELVAEAACRAGEILLDRGERTAARPLLERAVATGDATFAGQAASLLDRR